MKQWIFWVLLMGLVLLCGIGCATTDHGTTVKSTEKYETRVYEVFGMNCPACHGAVEKLVKRIPAVESAEADWQRKQLVVIVRPEGQFNDEDVYAAIRRANFTPGKRLK
ncbi:MAG: heavy-metal-associated domain-containing protein [Planctomycetota bacterium]